MEKKESLDDKVKMQLPSRPNSQVTYGCHYARFMNMPDEELGRELAKARDAWQNASWLARELRTSGYVLKEDKYMAAQHAYDDRENPGTTRAMMSRNIAVAYDMVREDMSKDKRERLLRLVDARNNKLEERYS